MMKSTSKKQGASLTTNVSDYFKFKLSRLCLYIIHSLD